MTAVQSVDWELGKIVRLEWSCGCTWDVEMTPVFCGSHDGKDGNGANKSGPTDPHRPAAAVPANPGGSPSTATVQRGVGIPSAVSSAGDSLPPPFWSADELHTALGKGAVPTDVYNRLRRYALQYKPDAVFKSRQFGQHVLSRYAVWTDVEIAEALR